MKYRDQIKDRIITRGRVKNTNLEVYRYKSCEII